MSKGQRKNDCAWEKLFSRHQILKNVEHEGKFIIAASSINEFREARLMTKFDHHTNLPKIFKDNELSILPITRGKYVIGEFQAYKSIDDIIDESIEHVEFPAHIQSLDYESITGESAAINSAFISGIFEHFLDEDCLFHTVSGRMGSGSFDFVINKRTQGEKHKINVCNSQIEIDAGFEGTSSLSLIEAKNSISDDFLIRQLYYPFRLWKNKIEKEIKSIFMTYSNGVYHLYQYKFEDPENYNSLVLKRHKKYRIEPIDITVDDLEAIMKVVETVVEPEVPFPQADKFERVINFCELLNEHEVLSKERVTAEYDFDVRQTDYYANAGRYLGLIKKEKSDVVEYSLTMEAKAIFSKSNRDRQLKFVELMFSHSVFFKTFKQWLRKARVLSKSEIVDVMKTCKLFKINSEETFRRRASTISAWLDWVLSLLQS